MTPNIPILARLSDYALTRLFVAANRYADWTIQEALKHPKHAALWQRRIKDAESAIRAVGKEIARREKHGLSKVA